MHPCNNHPRSSPAPPAAPRAPGSPGLPSAPRASPCSRLPAMGSDTFWCPSSVAQHTVCEMKKGAAVDTSPLLRVPFHGRWCPVRGRTTSGLVFSWWTAASCVGRGSTLAPGAASQGTCGHLQPPGSWARAAWRLGPVFSTPGPSPALKSCPVLFTHLFCGTGRRICKKGCEGRDQWQNKI